MKTNWYWRTFQDLSIDELYDLLAVRQEVFALEQKCLYQDLDYLDQKALHLLGMKNQKLVAYLRFFPQGSLYKDAHSFGRVLTAASERGRGLAKEAMKEVLHHLKKKNISPSMIISAQLYLREFYTSFGLQAIGEPYDEDGIPHIRMKGLLKSKA